jgi:hypothetical protein
MELWAGLMAIVALLGYGLIWVWRRLNLSKVTSKEKPITGSSFSEGGYEKDPYSEITALPNFDWKTTEPLKLRPFKAKYHLTMGGTPQSVRDRISQFGAFSSLWNFLTGM